MSSGACPCDEAQDPLVVTNQPGLSTRTVQRRVRALKDLVSADTRLQLGFHAANKGRL